MEATAAKIILANLRDRIEIGLDGKFRLPGIVTQHELDALEFLISGQLVSSTPTPPIAVTAVAQAKIQTPASPVVQSRARFLKLTKQ